MRASHPRWLVAGALAASSVLHGSLFLLPAGRRSLSARPVDALVEVELVPDSPTPPPSDEDRAPRIPLPSQEPAPHFSPRVLPHQPAAVPAAASPALTAGDETPSFTIAIGTGGEGAHGAVASAVPALPQGQVPETTLDESDVDQRARLVRGLAPAYPESARAAGVEGDVRLEIVVDTSGAVESAHVLGGVGSGLDEAALSAIHRFRFAPATKASSPVRVRMRWSIQFRLE